MRILRAGALYFALVFAIGFLLGTIRVIVVGPSVGELNAVLLELPVILAASWFICRRLTTSLQVPPDLTSRVGMGASAFVLLLAAEVVLSVFLFGNSLDRHFENFRTFHGAIGLAGQFAFALFPIIQLRQRR